MQRLHRLAERHARLSQDSFAACELVTDVIEDMLFGDLTCDLARALAPQIERHVQRRASRLREAVSPRRSPLSRRRALRRPRFVPLDKAPARALAVDAPHHSLERSEHDARDAAELVRRIREYARDDDAVQQLLAVHDQGRAMRRAVHSTGMKEWVYRAARERLFEYATMAVAAVSMTAPPAQPADVVDAPEQAGRAMLGVGPHFRTARAQRAVARQLGRRRKLRSA